VTTLIHEIQFFRTHIKHRERAIVGVGRGRRYVEIRWFLKGERRGGPRIQELDAPQVLNAVVAALSKRDSELFELIDGRFTLRIWSTSGAVFVQSCDEEGPVNEPLDLRGAELDAFHSAINWLLERSS
jgi:hypothetical protein